MKHFVRAFFPTVRVVHIHSGEDIFRFQHNVDFVNKKLKPIVQESCRRLAAAIGDASWTDFLHVCISLTGGSPARIAALNSGLREFRPDYLHILQPKAFFHSHVVDSANVCFEPYERIELRPAVSRNRLKNDDARALVEEMVQLRARYLATSSVANDLSDLASFWLRKTKKPVLAVLLAMSPDEPDRRIFYHGINMEVSMPTGSLCAERNCISTALASNFRLRRQDLKMIAVLSMESVKKNDSGRRLRSMSSDFARRSSGEHDEDDASSSSPRRSIKRRRMGTPYDTYLNKHELSPDKAHREISSSSSIAHAEDTLNPIATLWCLYGMVTKNF